MGLIIVSSRPSGSWVLLEVRYQNSNHHLSGARYVLVTTLGIFTYIDTFCPYIKLVTRYYYIHFLDEENETPKFKVTCPTLQNSVRARM